MSKAQKILRLTENNLVNSDELQQLLNYLETNFYNKFRPAGGKKSDLWANDIYSIYIIIPLPENDDLDIDILILNDVFNFFKTSKYQVKRDGDRSFFVKYPKVNLPAEINTTTLRDFSRRQLMRVRCYNRNETEAEIQVYIYPNIDCKEFIIKYRPLAQINIFNFYVQSVLQACDVLVKAIRLLDVENLK